MRRIFVGVMLATVLAVPAVPARAIEPSPEAGYALLTGVSNLGYFPLKVLMAGGGLMIGTVASVLAGGNERVAYAIWVPTASGTYFLTPENLSGETPVDFIGKDYADTPSGQGKVGDRTRVYDAMYDAR